MIVDLFFACTRTADQVQRMNPETTLIEDDSISIDDLTLIEPSAEHVTSTTETSTVVESDESNGSRSDYYHDYNDDYYAGSGSGDYDGFYYDDDGLYYDDTDGFGNRRFGR